MVGTGWWLVVVWLGSGGGGGLVRFCCVRDLIGWCWYAFSSCNFFPMVSKIQVLLRGEFAGLMLTLLLAYLGGPFAR